MGAQTIREILGDRKLFSVGPDTKIENAARLMAEHKIGAVAVIDGGKLAGILSERDIVFRVVGKGLHADATLVADAMTSEPVTVEISEPISDTLALKLGNAFRHLPVMENGRVVGLLSYRDIPPEYVMMFERFREMVSSRADEDR